MLLVEFEIHFFEYAW